MRDYSKVSPKFWIGKTGKALRKKGVEATIVGMYLMTAPTANMLGLYYLTIGSIAHETGLGIEGASKGLRCAIEAGFCDYDEDAEVVWVYEMAGYQIAKQLKPDDKRCIGIQNDYNDLPENKFLQAFYAKYSLSFHMSEMRENASSLEAPSKTLRSQEQEQEQEQKQKQEQDQAQGSATGSAAAPAKKTTKSKSETDTSEAWQAYTQAYRDRYKVDPVRNATVNTQMVNFVKRLGVEAPAVAEFYVWHNNAWYVKQAHCVGAMLSDAEALRTQWLTGDRMTSTKAQQADRTQTNGDVFGKLIAEAEERELREVANGN